MKNLPILVTVLLLITGCRSEANRSQLTSLEIGGDVHLGARAPQVIAILESKHIEHSSYRIDPTKGRIITAVSRDRSNWNIIRADHVVDFRFDSSDRLIAKTNSDYLTGP